MYSRLMPPAPVASSCLARLPVLAPRSSATGKARVMSLSLQRVFGGRGRCGLADDGVWSHAFSPTRSHQKRSVLRRSSSICAGEPRTCPPAGWRSRRGGSRTRPRRGAAPPRTAAPASSLRAAGDRRVGRDGSRSAPASGAWGVRVNGRVLGLPADGCRPRRRSTVRTLVKDDLHALVAGGVPPRAAGKGCLARAAADDRRRRRAARRSHRGAHGSGDVDAPRGGWFAWT
jgi:hypothetical protein